MSNCLHKVVFCSLLPPHAGTQQQDRVCHKGTVNGIFTQDIVVDTVANKTLVHRKFVTPADMVEGEITISCAHGDSVSYPLAAIQVSLGGRDLLVHVGVVDKLPAAALLGWDIPDLMDLVKPTMPSQALAVVTRTRRQTDDHTASGTTTDDTDAATRSDTDCQDATTVSITQDIPLVADDPDGTDNILDDSILAPAGTDRPHLTRAQKCQLRQQYREHSDPSPSADTLPEMTSVNISATKLRNLQDEDNTLVQARLVADGQPSTVAGCGFFRRDGLLYRRYQPPGTSGVDDTTEQLVLLLQCRPAVLQLAHDIPLAGHLGRRKTTSRILRFYCPGIFRDVSDYCRSCPQCQKSSPRGRHKAPLIPLPIMDVLFKRIAMDIIGRSSSGHRYVLVICDYATRYPEAIPLRTFDADRIAKELVTFFARVGVPDEILTD